MKNRLVLGLLVAISLSASAYGYYPLWERTSIFTHANGQGIAAADFNGDNRPDVVTRRNGPHVVDLLLTNADATLAAPVTIYSASTLTDMIAADANGDGKTDVLIVESSTPALAVLLANGDGTFASPVNTTLSISPQRIATADFTGDGKLDVLVWNTAGALGALYAGNGAGAFSLVWSPTFAAAPRWIQAGDLDVDGKADFIIGFGDSTPYHIYYGHGDGTFDAPVTLGTINPVPTRIALADLDGDDDPEILVIHFTGNTLTVALNTGSRTFASPVVHNVLQGGGTSGAGNPIDLAVNDFNDDGHADVLLTLANQRLLGTFRGNGTGWLGSGVYVPAGSIPGGQLTAPRFLAPADFDLDGRIDVALGGSISTALWRNIAGDIKAYFWPEYRTISIGQTARFRFDADDLQSAGFFSYPITVPVPTGTIILRSNGTDLGMGMLDAEGKVTIDVASLPLGTHLVTAHYSGDDNFRAAISEAVEQIVVTETSSVTISNTHQGQQLPYGQTFNITATVTSQVDDEPFGMISLYVDRQLYDYAQPGPVNYWTIEDLTPGTHSIHAVYEGTPTHPPATSAAITQVIVHAATTTTVGQYVAGHGNQTPVAVRIQSESLGQSPGGTVRLYEGQTLLATVTLNNQCCREITVNIPVSLGIGTHYLHATYSGDARYLPSQSTSASRYVVLQDQGFFIDVWAEGTTITARGIYPQPPGGHFKIHRRIGNGPWTSLTSSVPIDAADGEPGIPHAYYMQAFNNSGQVVATSNVDLAMVTTFTENPVTAGMPIKAIHFSELVSAMNTLRSAAGLGAINVTGIAAGQPVRASQITALRNGINEARVALGATAVSFDALTTIRASDVQQLRDAIR
jgi:Bacterial Ig-like domain (group 3)/FG-GAP-like repeat